MLLDGHYYCGNFEQKIEIAFILTLILNIIDVFLHIIFIYYIKRK